MLKGEGRRKRKWREEEKEMEGRRKGRMLVWFSLL